MSILVDWFTFPEKYKKPKVGGFPTGSRVYTGHQGTGKTLSMVEYIFRIRKKYPNCKVFSNIVLHDFDYDYISDDSVLEVALDMRNGDDGVLIVLDEAHLYFGKKSGIPLSVLSAISQQRKDRKRLVFSSQIWEELDVSLRKQVKEIIKCNKVMRFQINKVLDGESLHYDKKLGEFNADRIGTEIFKHNEKLYNCYDTYQRLVKNKDMVDLPTGSRSAAPVGLNVNVRKGIIKK